MSPAPKPTRVQRAVFASGRVLFLTIIFTGLGMALGLFIGIVSTGLLNASRHGALDMALAYRRVAIPTAIVFGAGALLFQVLAAIRTTLRPHS